MTEHTRWSGQLAFSPSAEWFFQAWERSARSSRGGFERLRVSTPRRTPYRADSSGSACVRVTVQERVRQRELRGPQAPAKPSFDAVWRLYHQTAPKKKLQRGQSPSTLSHLNGYCVRALERLNASKNHTAAGAQDRGGHATVYVLIMIMSRRQPAHDRPLGNVNARSECGVGSGNWYHSPSHSYGTCQ